MIKKFFVKLMGWQEQRRNIPSERHGSEQKEKEKMIHEEQKQAIRDKERDFESERKIPSEGKILGPSDENPEKRNA